MNLNLLKIMLTAKRKAIAEIKKDCKIDKSIQVTAGIGDDLGIIGSVLAAKHDDSETCTSGMIRGE